MIIPQIDQMKKQGTSPPGKDTSHRLLPSPLVLNVLLLRTRFNFTNDIRARARKFVIFLPSFLLPRINMCQAMMPGEIIKNERHERRRKEKFVR